MTLPELEQSDLKSSKGIDVTLWSDAGLVRTLSLESPDRHHAAAALFRLERSTA